MVRKRDVNKKNEKNLMFAALTIYWLLLESGDMKTDETINPSTLYSGVGARICDWRKTRGLKQSELAAKIDLERTSITNIEAGRQKMLLHTFVDIANALRVEPAELLQNTKPTDRIPRTLSRPERKFALQIKKQARKKRGKCESWRSDGSISDK